MFYFSLVTRIRPVDNYVYKSRQKLSMNSRAALTNFCTVHGHQRSSSENNDLRGDYAFVFSVRREVGRQRSLNASL